jgi:hypothetical protein
MATEGVRRLHFPPWSPRARICANAAFFVASTIAGLTPGSSAKSGSIGAPVWMACATLITLSAIALR